MSDETETDEPETDEPELIDEPESPEDAEWPLVPESSGGGVLAFSVGEGSVGQRVDVVLAELSGVSRSQVRRWIDESLVQVAGTASGRVASWRWARRSRHGRRSPSSSL